MDDFEDGYWETNMFLQFEELASYIDEAAISGYYDSDGTQSKNIVSERNRRKKLNERLYALRSVVPNITKMDKASIVKDAIEYIQSLHDEEKRIQAEISQLESSGRPADVDDDQQLLEANYMFNCSKPIKRTRLMGHHSVASGLVIPSPIELLELRMSNMGERTIVVSLTCSKRRDTMVKLCEIFESLKLKIITANITVFAGKLLKTVFLEVLVELASLASPFDREVNREGALAVLFLPSALSFDILSADDEEKEVLRLKIEEAIATLNGLDSPISI